MYELITDKVLEIGEYLSISLDKNNKIFLFNNSEEKIGEIIISDISIFRNRKLKAVVREEIKEGYNVSIVRFADLHRHSGYSLLDGASRIKDMVEKTEYVGALTDHGNMYGFLEYYKQMKKAGKQPILGFEAYCEAIEGEKEGYHLILLAKNKKGYKNLIKLTSLAFQNFYKQPHVSYSMLEKYNEGIIVTSACLGGEIPREIKRGNYKKAKKIALRFKKIFGDDFYIEIQRHNMGKEEDRINRNLIKLSKEIDVKLVATTDSHYTNKDEKEIHEILLCLQTGKTLLDEDRLVFQGDGYHIHSSDEMDFKFKDIPEALDNTLEIAEKCNGFKLDLDKIYMPKFEVPKDHTDDSYLEKLVWNGFNERFKGQFKLTDKEYIERIKHELSIIKSMGYSSYFLIVQDFISYAKINNIMVGPGRGSAVGSLVSYVLGITDLDPIPYGLLFERFLNPERVSMPDIDIDFCYERREEIVSYARKKYGENSVSKIITFGTLGARSVVRDVARVMNYPYSLGDKIAKAIPTTPGMTLKKAIEENPELKSMYESSEDIKKIINIAFRLEGLPRHASTHACGLIISDTNIDNYVPEAMVTKDGVKERTSQVTMNEVEELGLLKMDFLGLRTMTVIGHTIKSVLKNENEKIEYLKIPHNDPYVYRDLSKGKSYGVFQLESVGMRNLMSELYSDVTAKIRNFEKKYKVKGFRNPIGEEKNKKKFLKEMSEFGDELFERLIAGVALFRPGPMDYIPNYIKGMLNPEDIKYEDLRLKPILKTTYGQIVYQEQVIKIVQELAGYSLGRADLVRRAMGKKIDKVMQEEKDYFIKGCIKNKISKHIAESIWGKMEHFSRYAFNKSHAAAYAKIGITTAWLKRYFPIDFMASTINSFIDNADRLKVYLSICEDMGIKILPPDINKSLNFFSKEGDNIIFGLKGIKNISKTSDFILEERKQRGVFKDYQDFVVRMAKYQEINKRILQGLIYSGTLDAFKGTRNAKLKVLDSILKIASIEKREHQKGQLNLLDFVSEGEKIKEIQIPDVKEFEKDFKLEKEREFAGFYVTEHPIDEYIKYFGSENIVEIGCLLQEDINSFSNNNKVNVGGIIKDLKVFYTRKEGKPLYVFKVEDKTGELKCVVFDSYIEDNQSKLMEGKVVLVSGRVKEDSWGVQLIVHNMLDMKVMKVLKTKNKKPKFITVNITGEEQLNKLKDEILCVEFYRGKTPVYLTVGKKKFKANTKIKFDLAVILKLENIFGKNNYRIAY